MRVLNILVFWVLLGNLADLITTLIGLSFPYIYETNPIAVFMMNTNIVLYVGFKIFFPLVIVLGLVGIHGYSKKWYQKTIVEGALLILALFFTIVVINNVNVISKCL